MAVIPTRDFNENKYLVFATADGLIKKTEFLAYNTPIRADGIIAIKVRDGDELVQVAAHLGRGRHPHGLPLRPRRALQRGAACGRWAATPAASEG